MFAGFYTSSQYLMKGETFGAHSSLVVWSTDCIYHQIRKLTSRNYKERYSWYSCAQKLTAVVSDKRCPWSIRSKGGRPITYLRSGKCTWPRADLGEEALKNESLGLLI
jgi:hypothetical protein